MSESIIDPLSDGNANGSSLGSSLGLNSTGGDKEQHVVTGVPSPGLSAPAHRKRNAQKGGNVNDTEPTQRGRGLFTEGRSRRESGAVFYNLYTQHDISRVCFTSLARRPPEHENSYTVGHVCFIDRYLGFQQLTIDQTLSIRCRNQS